MPSARAEVPAIRLLFRQLPLALSANVIVAAMLVAALWTPERAGVFAGWLAVQIALVLLRLGLLLHYRRRRPADAELGAWTAVSAAGAGASGLVWGSTAVLFPTDPLSWLAVSFAIAGMAAGGLTTLSSHLPSFVLYLLGSLGPLTGALVAAGGRLYLSQAAMVVVFGVLLVAVACVLNRTLRQVMHLTAEKQRLLESLEEQVAERTAALQEANDRLQMEMSERQRAKEEAVRARLAAERADLAKSKFLAAASHDLRQPAQSLVLFTAALAGQLENHPARQVVGHIERAADALRTLLDSLLDISRLDAGTIVPQIRPTPLGPLLERLGAEYRLRAVDRGLRFRVVPTSTWLSTDPVLLDRILRNLIENALRYTARGDVLIGCRRRAGRISILVIDTGIGIADDQLEMIFEEFVQVDNPARDRSQGLGLGLAIVSRLSRILGHTVTVRSRLGRGSCFAVTGPMAAKPSAAVSAVA